jgi:hypothetical protein
VKIRTEQGGGSEKQGFGAAKGLANPTFGRIIAQPTCTSKSNPMNNRSNGKSRLISVAVLRCAHEWHFGQKYIDL